MSNKQYKEVAKQIDEKNSNGSAADQAYYVDTSRNVAVCMDGQQGTVQGIEVFWPGGDGNIFASLDFLHFQ